MPPPLDKFIWKVLFPSAFVAEHVRNCVLVSVVAIDITQWDERGVSEEFVEHVVLQAQGHDLADRADILLLHN